MYVCMHVERGTYVRMYVCRKRYVCTTLYVCMHVERGMYVCMYVCMHVERGIMYVCM